MKRLSAISIFSAAGATAAMILPALAAAPAPPAAAPRAAATVAPVVHDPVVVDARTEAVIKGGLKYLAAKQTPNGAWTSPGGAHPVAVTGYAVMAFLAAGQLPDQGEYGKNVKRGTDFLLSQARSDGFITSSESITAGRQSSNMYDHGIATIALGEVYGQTQDPKVREVLANSIKLIVGCQNVEGGWRYTPRPETADVSVTVLQVVALRVAKNSGISVPQSTIDRAVQYVKSCYDAPSGGFTYQAPNGGSFGGRGRGNNSGPGFARTAAAIYSLQVCGLYDDPLVLKGSRFLIDNYAVDRQWYTYGNFYAAPAMYMIGGQTWQYWYNQVKTELLSTAVTQPGDKSLAYWDGIDRNAREIGTSYVTAVYTMILAMPYHYVPVYQR